MGGMISSQTWRCLGVFLVAILFTTIEGAHAQYSKGCYVEKLNAFNAEKSRRRDEAEYSAVNRRYESLAREIDRNIIRAVGRINGYSGKITGILTQLGLEGITVLTNKLSCNDPDVATFCNANNKGKFMNLARVYAKLLGKRRSAIMELDTVDRTFGARQRRMHVQAILKWQTLLKEFNAEGDWKKKREACLREECLKDGGTADSCSAPVDPTLFPSCIVDVPGVDTAKVSEILLSGDAEKANDAATKLAQFNPGQYCPVAPFVPRQVASSDGCLKLFGIAEAIGAVFCSDKLSDSVT